MSIYEQELTEYMKEHGMGVSAMARRLGNDFRPQTVHTWVKRNEQKNDREVILSVDEKSGNIVRIEMRRVLWGDLYK